MSKNIVLPTANWSTSAIKYMPPKPNKNGGKAISIISTQTNRSLCIVTPSMMTWGISDFANDEGIRDGRFNISLCFPMEDRATEATNLFMQKLREFEEKVLDDVVANSRSWIGQPMSREIAKFNMTTSLKYSKNRDTGEIDYSKPPSIRAKVAKWEDKWNVEIYDTHNNLKFPCEDHSVEPSEFVPKLSSVVCILQCGGIWVAAGKWGITWKLVQCVVKPREVVNILGNKTCLIELSAEDRVAIENQQINEDVDIVNDDYGNHVVVPLVASISVATPTVITPVAHNTHVEDSDDENSAPVAPVVPTPSPVIKKVVAKKTETIPAAPVEIPEIVATPVAAAAPTVIKKKTVVKPKATA